MKATDDSVRLPVSLQKEASRLAQEDGVSLSHWVSVAVAQKIGAVESAADFFRCRSQGAGSVEEALAILDAANDIPPMPGDELPESYVLTQRT